MRDLTDRQYQVLRFIGDHVLDNRPAPTFREIAQEIRTRSTNGVNDHLRALERKGFIQRMATKSRHIELTPKARARLGVASPTTNFRTLLLDRLFAACVRWSKASTSNEASLAHFAMNEAIVAIQKYDRGESV